MVNVFGTVAAIVSVCLCVAVLLRGREIIREGSVGVFGEVVCRGGLGVGPWARMAVGYGLV